MENIPHHKDFTRSKAGDVSAFLCNFLEGRGITPKQVLRAAGLPTADLHHAFALQALYEAASPYMPATVVSDTDSDTQSARLVIRRAVEMESLQFVGCSWFIGLIGLGFRFTQNKSTSTELCALPRPSPVSSSTHLDAPGVPSTAGYVAIPPSALSDPDSREFSDSLLFKPTGTPA